MVSGKQDAEQVATLQQERQGEGVNAAAVAVRAASQAATVNRRPRCGACEACLSMQVEQTADVNLPY